jgi:hypothetical protein
MEGERWAGVRIEASMGEVDRGTPDSIVTVGRVTRFIELKEWGTELSVVQVAWCRERDDRLRRADPVLVLARRGRKWWIGPWWEWTDPLGLVWERDLREMILRVFEVDRPRA